MKLKWTGYKVAYHYHLSDMTNETSGIGDTYNKMH